MAGLQQPVRFPVPWALSPTDSHLADSAALRLFLSQSGFQEIRWDDLTDEAIAWFRDRPGESTATPFTLELLLGANCHPAYANQVCHLTEGRVRVIRALSQAPAS